MITFEYRMKNIIICQKITSALLLILFQHPHLTWVVSTVKFIFMTDFRFVSLAIFNRAEVLLSTVTLSPLFIPLRLTGWTQPFRARPRFLPIRKETHCHIMNGTNPHGRGTFAIRFLRVATAAWLFA